MRLRLLERYEKALVATIKDRWELFASGTVSAADKIPGCELCDFSVGCNLCPLEVFLEFPCHVLGYRDWANARDEARGAYNAPEVVEAAKVMLGNLRKCLRLVRAEIKELRKR